MTGPVTPPHFVRSDTGLTEWRRLFPLLRHPLAGIYGTGSP